MTEGLDWDFKLAFEFSKAFESDLGSKDDDSPPALPPKPPYQPRSLGDFSRVFEILGTNDSEAPSGKLFEPLEIRKSILSSSPSSFEPAVDFDEFVNNRPKGVRWNDQTGWVKERNTKEATHGSHEHIENDPAAKRNGDVTRPSPKKAENNFKGLFDIDSPEIRPIRLLTVNEQRARLIRRLRKRFPNPESLFATDIDAAISNLAGIPDPNGIHVFVDFSNILIGFYNRLKAARGMHEKAYVKQPPFSYPCLSLILERGREVARRILVGSTTKSLYSHTGPQKVAKHFSEAAACGYELSILERVSKSQPAAPVRRKKNGTGNGYATATSGDESGTFMELRRPTMAEQGVDEILQMKLLESLVDTAVPTTIVLASGDAAEAEYSGGFLKTVVRALSKGWKVEVVAWNHGLSKDYRNKEFLKRWDGKFKIIELDDFAEELLAIYA